jgi:hypothetical protein
MFADDTRLIANEDVDEDVENLQVDLDRVYNWARLKNMELNCTKFEFLRYGRNSELKENTLYVSTDNNVIEEKEVLRDLGMLMNNKNKNGRRPQLFEKLE